MLRIAPNGYQTKQYAQSPSFKSGNITVAELRQQMLQQPANVEKRVTKLISRTRDMMNEARAKLRKKGVFPVEPQFYLYSPKDGRITLQPMPNSRNGGFMLELDKKESVERIFVDKDLMDKITYERSRKTGFGTAVTRRYDTKNGSDNELTHKINETLDKYLSHFIKENEQEKRRFYIK